MENLEIYNKVRSVPKEAQREINFGYLKGKTDINPMWRIKILTEVFGPCGFGWHYDILHKWTEEGADGEVMAFADIALYVKLDGEWSKPIRGTGGNKIVELAKGVLKSCDEGFKMATTDAISVACKCLGIGADIYFENDTTKYSKFTEEQPRPKGTIERSYTPDMEIMNRATERKKRLVTIAEAKEMPNSVLRAYKEKHKADLDAMSDIEFNIMVEDIMQWEKS